MASHLNWGQFEMFVVGQLAHSSLKAQEVSEIQREPAYATHIRDRASQTPASLVIPSWFLLFILVFT